MRQGAVEGALLAKHHQEGQKMIWKKKNLTTTSDAVANNDIIVNNNVVANNNNYKTRGPKGSYLPCQHCGKINHSSFKCWRKPDAKCTKCNQLGHKDVICKSKVQQQEANAQVVNQKEEGQLFESGFNKKMVMAKSNNEPTVIFNPSTFKYMVSYDGLTIETTVTYKANVIEEWINFVSSTYTENPKVVGLDTEWTRVEYKKMKVAILQLCVENKCLIIQLFRMYNIPQSLRNFFTISDFKFAGVAVMNDLEMLENDYGLKSNINKGVDVAYLAKARWPDLISTGGLKSMAKELVGLDMKKPKKVCISEWKTKKLSLSQVEYASIDAYASFKIGKVVLN
ncbi:Werner Syndrome-like exonuclease, partial [Mucuna pruriens]